MRYGADKLQALVKQGPSGSADQVGDESNNKRDRSEEGAEPKIGKKKQKTVRQKKANTSQPAGAGNQDTHQVGGCDTLRQSVLKRIDSCIHVTTLTISIYNGNTQAYIEQKQQTVTASMPAVHMCSKHPMS